MIPIGFCILGLILALVHHLPRCRAVLADCENPTPLILLRMSQDELDVSLEVRQRNSQLTASTGWIEFELVDVSNEHGDWSLCAPQSFRFHYVPKPCPGQASFQRPRRSSFLLGGEGYDLHLEGNSIAWAPIVFHPRRGVYTSRVRVEESGLYLATVHRNGHRGCHLADCDVNDQVCPTTKSHGDRKALCVNATSSPCSELVTSRPVMVSPRQDSSTTTTTRPALPECRNSEIGTAPGRWVKYDVILPYLNSFGASPFGESSFPFVWQPFDCTLRWWAMNSPEVKACTEQDNFMFIGLSRERTDQFDVAQFQGDSHAWGSCLMLDKLGSNLYYFTLFKTQTNDMRYWIDSGKLEEVPADLSREIDYYKLCGNESRPLHIFASQEEMRLVEGATRDVWANLTTDYLSFLTSRCPNASVHFKTSPSLRIGYGQLSWQRMYEVSRLSSRIARDSFHLPVIDAFSITHPLIHRQEAYSDGLHLYRPDRKYEGNFAR